MNIDSDEPPHTGAAGSGGTVSPEGTGRWPSRERR